MSDENRLQELIGLRQQIEWLMYDNARRHSLSSIPNDQETAKRLFDGLEKYRAETRSLRLP